MRPFFLTSAWVFYQNFPRSHWFLTFTKSATQHHFSCKRGYWQALTGFHSVSCNRYGYHSSSDRNCCLAMVNTWTSRRRDTKIVLFPRASVRLIGWTHPSFSTNQSSSIMDTYLGQIQIEFITEINRALEAGRQTCFCRGFWCNCKKEGQDWRRCLWFREVVVAQCSTCTVKMASNETTGCLPCRLFPWNAKASVVYALFSLSRSSAWIPICLSSNGGMSLRANNTFCLIKLK